MREKELRLALVCFGGISLAIYMHGISKEILKLVRASSRLHAITDRAERARAGFFDHVDPSDPEYDTEAIYFELLRDIGRQVELRVIVDAIAGASAGGINGTMLARALAHDLPMASLRDLWLDKADVSELLASEARAGAWSKFFLKPFIWAVAAMGLVGASRDLEVRRKLSLFVRSRWFKPPFDGTRMAEFMYDAAVTMGEPSHPSASLLPASQQLELFVTLTDFYGYQQLVELHDPPLIHEREHRHILCFSYRRWPDGEIETDFALSDAPALAFAARATSSFPGAFPPAQIGEVDRLVAARGERWPGRERFIANNFASYRRAGLDPTEASFIDGSVLNNKPFHEAIMAIQKRAAYRQVDRRLVYIDPDPTRPHAQVARHAPGFFSALKGALSDIPRNEPIAEELNWVAAFNERVRRLKSIIHAARPQIAQLVSDVAELDRPASLDRIRAWREAVNARVAQDAGFAYEGYVRLKLASVRAFVGHLLVTLCGVPERSLAARAIAEIVDAWAVRRGIAYDQGDSHALRLETGVVGPDMPHWIRFLLAFDVDYRKRRLQFMVQGQNQLYEMLDDSTLVGMSPAPIDSLKRAFYHCLDTLRHREGAARYSAETRALASELFGQSPPPEAVRQLQHYAAAYAETHDARIDELIGRLAREIDLDATTHDVDALLAGLEPGAWVAAARREVLVNYLGFPFWDLLTFSVASWRNAGEFDEILIDRISPQDSSALGRSGKFGLKGTQFGHFGAFFSRAYRENDYLLGRLHAVDRLIDIVCDSAGAEAIRDKIDVLGLKRRAFERILSHEARHLPQSAELIADLHREFGAMAGAARPPRG